MRSVLAVGAPGPDFVSSGLAGIASIPDRRDRSRRRAGVDWFNHNASSSLDTQNLGLSFREIYPKNAIIHFCCLFAPFAYNLQLICDFVTEKENHSHASTENQRRHLVGRSY